MNNMLQLPTKCVKWAEEPSATEQQRCENAQRMVNEAIKVHPNLKNRNIKVFLQGSYRNRTNVRQESDVDVCVLCEDVFFSDYSHTPNINSTNLGFTVSDLTFTELRHEIEEALVTKFGRNYVKNGDKAFNIRENTYRVNADVVPTFEGRLYYYDNYKLTYYSGTVLKSNKNGQLIYNWPEQHYVQGADRHRATAGQFKKKVRILKNLCNEMRNQGIASAGKVSSFLLESLVFNCPDKVFTAATHYDCLRRVISHLFDATANDTTARDMVEVNNIKFLFHGTQSWNRNDVNQFLKSAWNYGGF